MIEYLENAEITRVTGETKPGQQAVWLKDRGIPHQVDGKRIIVSRIHVQAWLEGRPTRVSTGPNWAALSNAQSH